MVSLEIFLVTNLLYILFSIDNPEYLEICFTAGIGNQNVYLNTVVLPYSPNIYIPKCLF